MVAEARAIKLIEKYAILRPEEIILEDLAYALGIEVQYQPLDGAEALLVRCGDKGGITVNSKIPERGRKRFAIAHEIGHWLLHEQRTQFYLCTGEDMRDYKTSVEEAEANIFAAELLMPSGMLEDRYRTEDPALWIPLEIAKIFDVSVTAATLRYVQKFKQPVMVAFSSDGRLKWWRRNEDKVEYIYLERDQTISPESRAAQLPPGRAVDEKMETVIWDAWFSHLPPQGLEVCEQAMRFEVYNTVMSLIWLRETDDE